MSVSHFDDAEPFATRLSFVFLNSFYTFYWDVAKDWDLAMFSSAQERNNPEHPWGLRRHMHFHRKEMYYGAIVIDLLLRCTWSLKLSPHLDRFNDLEGGIYAMEFLEVLRRWMWIFFRVETEWGSPPYSILCPDTNSINKCEQIGVLRRTISYLVITIVPRLTMTRGIWQLAISYVWVEFAERRTRRPKYVAMETQER